LAPIIVDPQSRAPADFGSRARTTTIAGENPLP
jgi:hypothetical protein